MSVVDKEVLEFSRQMNFKLKNYVDRAILQTLIDSKDENDEPLRIMDVTLFKGTDLEKTIDRLVVDESLIVDLLYKKYPTHEKR